MRCGIKSGVGTTRGKWMNEGSRTVAVGTESSRLDLWLLSIF